MVGLSPDPDPQLLTITFSLLMTAAFPFLITDTSRRLANQWQEHDNFGGVKLFFVNPHFKGGGS